MRGKGPKAPFALLTVTILLFRRKKDTEEKPASPEPFPVPEILKKTITETGVTKARDRLRIASLERDIISDALTRIYEAESKGQLTESERNQLVQRYKVDLKRVDGEIDTYKKVVDLHELESAKEDLLKSFHEKLMEIDSRINQIKPSIQRTPAEPQDSNPASPPPSKTENTASEPSQPTPSKEKSPKEKPKNKAEERLEAIREEVLKAMDRLEQIETEG